MDQLLLIIIFSTFILSLITFVAVVLLAFNKKLLDNIIFSLVAIAAGSMLGTAFLHLLPEAIDFLSAEIVLKTTLFSILAFYLLEKIMHWHHPHNEPSHVHSFGYLNLMGDLIHNFIDGLILASTFIVDINLGFTTLFVLALHEIPQELSDFGVLLYAGFTKKKALVLNFFVGVSSVLGGILGYYLASSVESFVPYLLPVAAGGFIYIATSDLVPSFKKERQYRKSINATIMFMLGIALPLLISTIE